MICCHQASFYVSFFADISLLIHIIIKMVSMLPYYIVLYVDCAIIFNSTFYSSPLLPNLPLLCVF